MSQNSTTENCFQMSWIPTPGVKTECGNTAPVVCKWKHAEQEHA